MRLARIGDGLGRPAGIVLIDQSKGEQPLAGIGDDVERQCRRPLEPALCPLIVDLQPQLGDPSCRFRPAPVRPRQGGAMRLIGKARNIGIRLRHQPHAGDPPFRRSLQHRQLGAFDQILDQRRGEDGLARARQAGDPDAQPRPSQAEQAVAESQRRIAGLVEIGGRRHQAGRLTRPAPRPARRA